MKKLTFCLLAVALLPISGFSQSRSISITFDDLPATNAVASEFALITDQLTGVFKEYDIPAVGFVNERKLFLSGIIPDSRIELLRKWLDVGAELGNHTFSHISIDNATIEEYKVDVKKGERVLRSLLKKYDQELTYFRHTQLRTGPTEEYRQQLNAFLEEEGYTIAPVTMDNDEYIYAYCYSHASRRRDTKTMQLIKEDYLKYMEDIFVFYEKQSEEFLGREPKQILLLHANLLNAHAFGDIAEMLKKRGYSFISLSEALEDEAYDLPEVQSRWGLSWLHRWMLAAGEEPENHPGVTPQIQKLFDEYRGN